VESTEKSTVGYFSRLEAAPLPNEKYHLFSDLRPHLRQMKKVRPPVEKHTVGLFKKRPTVCFSTGVVCRINKMKIELWISADSQLPQWGSLKLSPPGKLPVSRQMIANLAIQFGVSL
jgi:hypothetical protein